MRKGFALVVGVALALGLAPGASVADHCDRSGQGIEQAWASIGFAPTPTWNGIAGHGTARFNLANYGCTLENPGRVRAAGVDQQLPAVYTKINTGWFPPGATHVTPWATMDNGCSSCQTPYTFQMRYRYANGQTGSYFNVPDVIFDANTDVSFRSRNPIAFPNFGGGVVVVEVLAHVDNRATPTDLTDTIWVYRYYAKCQWQFQNNGSGLLAPVLNPLPDTEVCMPA